MVASNAKPPMSIGVVLNALAFLSLSVVGLMGLYALQGRYTTSIWDALGWVSLGAIGIYRWLWFVFKIIRSRVYLHRVFPRWRRRADAVPVADLPHVCFLVPTYKEQPWITERVFRAIAHEARTLVHPITVLVNSSSDEENAAIRAILDAEDPGLSTIRLIQMTQKDGKRKAMADALRELAQLGLPDDTVIALMDGDSELTPGTLRRCLPFFRLFPRMGALTTDELPVVEGSYLFSEWFHLRFAQRHYQMCSDSLARKVMCLTGRFSLFRAEAALHPTFAEQLESDTLDDWLWGRFKFLSGDDKSTWYWLLRRRYDMLYIPDALVYSIETIKGSVVERAYQNMRRWYGNMLRSNGRAIALGPQRVGWFVWYNLLDQRVSIWTCLLTPSLLLLYLLQGRWLGAGVIAAWILFSRPLMLAIVFLGRSSHLKPIHFPLLLLSQWGASLVKIWTQMNLATQNWSNRGNQSLSAEGTGMERVVKRNTSRFLLASQVFSFVILLCWLSGAVNPLWDWQGLMLQAQPQPAQTMQWIDAAQHGVIPSDGEDDAIALQTLIDQLPAGAATIQLPLGELDFAHPVEIHRSHLHLLGYGASRTVIRANLEATTGLKAALMVQPPAAIAPAHPVADTHPHRVHDVFIQGLTLRAAAPTPLPIRDLGGISLKQVTGASLTQLDLDWGDRHPILLNQTDRIVLENVVINGSSVEQAQIVAQDATGTEFRSVTIYPTQEEEMVSSEAVIAQSNSR